jgi:hypothetical protein
MHTNAFNRLRAICKAGEGIPMQMQTLSARIPVEDMQWLAGLDIEGAVSPSDKLRALIGQMRRQHEGTLDYQGSLSWLRDLVSPFVTAIRALEHENRMHSEVLTLVAEALPPIMATLLSERGLAKDAKARAIEVEEIVVQRCLQLLTSILRLAVTRDAGCYSPTVIDDHVGSVLEIADVVRQARKIREETHG